MRSFLLLLLLIAGPAMAEWRLGDYKEVTRMSEGGVAWEREAVNGDSTVRLTGFSFSNKNYVFEVVDNPPPSKLRLATAMPPAGAVAGINASYFHSDYTPLGLVVSQGKTLHSFETAKLLSGVLALRNGRLELMRSTAFKAATSGVTEAMQAGPWLVENSRPVAGLNSERRARRSLVATDGRGNWSIITVSPVTLAECAEVLASPAVFASSPVKEALNFDGGSSTALWVSGTPPPISIPEFGGVRNYLAIKPRMP